MKRNLLTRILSAGLAALTVLVFAVSCSGIKETTLLTLGDQEISDAVFTYLCALEKTNYLYELYKTDREKTSASELQDNSAIWLMVDADGNTLGDTLKNKVLHSSKFLLYLADYAEKQGYSATEDVKKSMKSQLDTIVSNFPDKKTFNETVSQYGVNYDILYRYYVLQGLASIGNYLLFGDDGKFKISDEDAAKRFNETYVTINCIFINTKNKSYPNGKTVYLPDDEREEKIRLAEELYRKVLAGEDFAALYEEYSDKYTDEAKESGYTFSAGNFGSESAERKSFEMKTNEVAKVETEAGIYIIKKLPLDASKFAGFKDNIIAMMEEERQEELLKTEESRFELDKELFDSVNIGAILHVV